jgi:hypothetical protein
MKLWPYIQGNRRGIEAHRIEKEAMKDPFLADALEGYEKTQSNHQRKATRLQKEIIRRQQRIINKSTNKKTNHLKAWSIAAGILIIVGLCTWFLLDNTPIAKDTPIAVQSEEKLLPVDSLAQISQDEIEVIPEKTPKVQAITDNAKKKEIQKQAEPVPVPEDSLTVEEKAEVAPIAPETPVIPQEAEASAITRTDTLTTSDTVLPQPVVGMQAYMDYIQRNIKRPTDEECRDVKGSVVVIFKIGQSGRPYNIRVTQGLCSSINLEAIRLIINGPDWKKGGTSDEAMITIDF